MPKNMCGFNSASIAGQLIQSVDEMPRGVFLRLIKPQPFCKLVFSSKDGNWVYPEESTWKEWQDPSYKGPDNMETARLNMAWTPPYRPGGKVFVQEPWAFRACCDCYACETPQVTYCGKRGCFLYPTPQNQDYEQFQPAHLMPREAARTFLRINAIQMMRLWDIPVEQLRKEGFICPNGNLFPEDLRQMWNLSLSAEDSQLYSWEKNPFVWVIFFEK